jgi:hypothetical protein
MRRRVSVKAVGLAVGLTMALAAVVATSSASAATISQSKTTSTERTPTQILLCGTFMPGTDRFTSSNIDHPSGSTAMGKEYPYTGQNCDSNGASSNGMFTWTISHSNVNVATELGTEHGMAMLSSDSNKAAGFNGRITNYDFNSTPDTCGNRNIFYASGHQFDSSCSPSGPGNFNTHGGAAAGNHFNGKYQTIVYKDDSNMNCPTTGMTYCFEGIIEGSTN